MKKPIRKFELRNVSPDDFINQAKGLRLVKERKRAEKNLHEFKHKKPAKQVFTSKRQKVSDQIQRGFDIATKWRNEDVYEES